MEPGSPEFVIISSGGVMILILLSLFGNILVCCAVYQSRQLRARVNYLIVSLAVADILIASVAMPIWIYSEITTFRYLSGEQIHRLIRFWTFVDILGGIASIANLTVISYERLWSVCSPLNHRRYLTNFTLGGMIAVAWSYAAAIAVTSVVWFGEDWSILYNAILGFFLPLLLIIVAYVFIFVIVNKSPRNVISNKENKRINITICVIVGIFFICWAPHFIASIASVYNKNFNRYVIHNLWIRSLFKWLHYANSCVNPVVYGIANAQYKDAFKLVFKKFCLTRVFKTDRIIKNKRTAMKPSLNLPLLNTKIEREGRVELSIQEKEEKDITYSETHAANENVYSKYLPGDYRALPVIRSNGQSSQISAQNRNRLACSQSSTTLLERPGYGQNVTTSLERPIYGGNLTTNPEQSVYGRNSTTSLERAAYSPSSSTNLETVCSEVSFNSDPYGSLIDYSISPYDNSMTLQRALLNPQSLARTSYI